MWTSLIVARRISTVQFNRVDKQPLASPPQRLKVKLTTGHDDDDDDDDDLQAASGAVVQRRREAMVRLA